MHSLLRPLLAAVLLIGTGILNAAEPFEGRASFDIREGKRKSGVMTYSVKGDNVRIKADIPGRMGR